MSERYINQIKLILERGDGQCIDLGPVPDLKDPISIAKFLVLLNDNIENCGTYDFGESMQWSPEELDFVRGIKMPKTRG